MKVTLDGKPLVRPDGRQPAFAADGIAISKDGKTLYYQALTGKTLYSIDTAKLRPDVSGADRAAAVKTVAQTHVADGLWMSKAGVLYARFTAGGRLPNLVDDQQDKLPRIESE